ncbi:MAG: hypothetical protein IJJ10_06575 [Bacillus sp. (in: Bacteria)]|nr:hypothetical protein [Bacillus sp. (in: firmicutes)]
MEQHTICTDIISYIFFGSGKRALSERYGCWCYLCAKHHNMSNEGVHFNKKLDDELKKKAQAAFIEANPDKNFMEIFGRNYA